MPQEGPQTFSLQRNPQNDTHYRLVTLCPVYSGSGLSESQVETAPDKYIFGDGSYCVAKENETTYVHACFGALAWVTIGGEDVFSQPGECDLLFDGNALVAAKRSPEQMLVAITQRENESPLQYALKSLLCLDLPAKTEYQIGDTWTSMNPLVSSIASNEFLGYANVGGISTVIIKSESKVDTDSLKAYYDSVIAEEKKKGTTEKEMANAAWKFKHQIEELQETKIMTLTSYIDTETSLIVKQDGCVETRFLNDPNQDNTLRIISQTSKSI